MEQNPGFMINSTLVCQLKKSLYGLKNDSQAWYKKIDLFFVNIGFKCYEFDHSIYVLCVDGNTLIIDVYADDLILTCNTWIYSLD